MIGGFDRLGEWLAQQRVDGVIITCLMDEKKQAHVARVLGKTGLRVTVWACEEKTLCAAEEALPLQRLTEEEE